MAPSLDGLVDLEHYPIHDLDSGAGCALIAEYSTRLASDGAIVLPGFITPPALGEMIAEVRALAPMAYAGQKQEPIYYGMSGRGFPVGHPRRALLARNLSQLSFDLLADGSCLRQVYLHPDLHRFFATVRDSGPIYPMACPVQGVSVAGMAEGSNLQWHFDPSNFFVSILIQAPEAGGEFQYAPDIRVPDDENYDEVQCLVDGSSTGYVTLPQASGDLSIFRGRYSMHRVTPVRGARTRYMAVLSYEDQPGIVSKEESNRLIYGPRVAGMAAAVEGGRTRSL